MHLRSIRQGSIDEAFGHTVDPGHTIGHAGDIMAHEIDE